MSRIRSFLTAHAARYAVVTSLVAGAILFGGSAYAATSPQAANTNGNGNGLKISPVRTDITIDKGTSRTVSMTVENITGFQVTVRGVTNDFVPSTDESGEPRIILDDTQRAPGNSFKSLISSIPTLTLNPNERKEVKVTLSVPASAASGGYYGAVRFSPGNGENDKNVALTASVGSIFLVRVPGEITEKLSVESFTVAHAAYDDKGKITKMDKSASLFSSGPIALQTRFRNFGNIHVQPFGKIYIKNFSGKIVETIEINNAQPRGSVLPQSIRKFDIPVKNQKFFGKYTAEASFGYGTNGELLLAKKTFYVIPYKLIGVVIAVILFAIFVLPRLIRTYNEAIIRKAKQNRNR